MVFSNKHLLYLFLIFLNSVLFGYRYLTGVDRTPVLFLYLSVLLFTQFAFYLIYQVFFLKVGALKYHAVQVLLVAAMLVVIVCVAPGNNLVVATPFIAIASIFGFIAILELVSGHPTRGMILIRRNLYLIGFAYFAMIVTYVALLRNYAHTEGFFLAVFLCLFYLLYGYFESGTLKMSRVSLSESRARFILSFYSVWLIVGLLTAKL